MSERDPGSVFPPFFLTPGACNDSAKSSDSNGLLLEIRRVWPRPPRSGRSLDTGMAVVNTGERLAHMDVKLRKAHWISNLLAISSVTRLYCFLVRCAYMFGCDSSTVLNRKSRSCRSGFGGSSCVVVVSRFASVYLLPCVITGRSASGLVMTAISVSPGVCFGGQLSWPFEFPPAMLVQTMVSAQPETTAMNPNAMHGVE
jgi:hypothetical protein